MPLSDDLIKRTRKSVKNYKDKVRILKLKGVSSSAFQKVGSAKDLIKAYGEDPKGLRKRLRELDEFSTKGKVYKSKGPAQKKCDQMNEERQESNKAVVLCADNWHKERN